MASVKLADHAIHIKVDNDTAEYWAVKAISVRRFDKKTQTWQVPFECAAEAVRRLNVFGYVEIDPKVRALAERHEYLTKNKFNLALDEETASLIKTPMLKHQAAWLAYARNFKAIANLCEQGTGKSKMALDWASIKGLDPVLLICKNSNVYKWRDEVRKHSDYVPFVLKGHKVDRMRALSSALDCGTGNVICIINYEYVDALLEYLQKVTWGGIILDESTAIKSSRSKRHKAVVHLGDLVKHRLILTGTPLVNSPVDAYGQFRFLNHNVFGTSFEAFKQRYCELGGYAGYQVIDYKNVEEMQDKIEKFSFRVLKRDCLDLPPKIFEKYDVEASDDWYKGYTDMVNSSILELGDVALDNTLAITRINRALQYCDGFLYRDSTIGDAVEVGTPKFNELVDFMEDHFQGNDRLIIWAHFKASIRYLMKHLPEKFPHIKVRGVTGETPAINRQQLINTFNDDYTHENKNFCLILQTAAMMHGIDIRCDTAVYYSLSWSNEEWQQSQDRIHGINRGRAVPSTYIVLAIPGTIEETVYRALQRKQAISAMILKDKVSLTQAMRGVYGRTDGNGV